MRMSKSDTRPSSDGPLEPYPIALTLQIQAPAGQARGTGLVTLLPAGAAGPTTRPGARDASFGGRRLGLWGRHDVVRCVAGEGMRLVLAGTGWRSSRARSGKLMPECGVRSFTTGTCSDTVRAVFLRSFGYAASKSPSTFSRALRRADFMTALRTGKVSASAAEQRT
jgi:hypothetical protein